MYQHILMATDLSDASKITVNKAREVADQNNAKLSLIHIIEPIPAYGYLGVADMGSPELDDVKQVLATFAAEWNVSPEDQHIEIGPTKLRIIEFAENNKVDLIILGSHGHGGITRLLGSTANAILHSAECDVLTVRYEID